MIARVQAGIALLVAVGVHLGAFAVAPDQAGAVSSGAGGVDLVSLAPVDASLAAMVQSWDDPPPLTDDVPVQETPTPFTPTPPFAPAEAAPHAQMSALAAPSTTEAMPKADISLPTPAIRPKARPKAAAAPARPPKTAAPGRAAQKAAGSGGGAAAGNGGTARAATLSNAQANDLRATWGASIRAQIERRKRYPADAGGAAGTVTVRLTVTRAGALSGVSVARSSGSAALDTAALNAVRAAAGFPAAPGGLTDASYSFTLPMTFAR